MQEYQLTLKDKRIVWGKAIDLEPLYLANILANGREFTVDLGQLFRGQRFYIGRKKATMPVP